MAQLEAERKQLETNLADPDFYARTAPGEVRALSRRCTEVIGLITTAEERWLQVHTELEAIGTA